jgi:hypothetical protein
MEKLQLKINSRLKDYARRLWCDYFQIFMPSKIFSGMGIHD